MKIVIDINEHLYKMIKTFGFVVEDEDAVAVSEAIMKGTPLQEGKWISKKCRDGCYLPCCSVCGESSGTLYEYNYCPNCGAEMEVEE